MKNVIFYLSIIFSTLVCFTTIAEQEEHPFSDAELAQMLAPIALYPDSLLTHILIASTYPIEIIEAHRWLKKNDDLTDKQMTKSLEAFDWDASVKALIPFERILGRLSEDLSWTQELGDAFLQDEARVLQNIQILRKQAELAGNLEKMDNMDVSYEDDNIIIQPREKEIVYVPYYDTRMVYGSWHWSAYPPVYWQPYHSVYVSHYSPFYWHSGIHISFNYFFSAFHWHNRHVVVINPHHSHTYRPRRLIASEGYAKRWSHQPSHRKGVAYRTKHTSDKYHSKRVGVHRTSKQLNTSHRNFRKSLHVTKQSHNKVQHNKKHSGTVRKQHSLNNKTKAKSNRAVASQRKQHSLNNKAKAKSNRAVASQRKQHSLNNKTKAKSNRAAASQQKQHSLNNKTKAKSNRAAASQQKQYSVKAETNRAVASQHKTSSVRKNQHRSNKTSSQRRITTKGHSANKTKRQK